MSKRIDIEIKVPSQTCYLAMIGSIGEKMAHEVKGKGGENDTLADQINIVLTEALANAIQHANKADPEKEVLVSISLSDHELLIKVYDSGKGFELPPELEMSNGNDVLDENGRGIFIMRSLMDSVTYRKANGGNVLEMRKTL